MANQNSSGLVVLTSVLGAALVGAVVYLLVKKSSTPVDATNALANVQSAKSNLASLQSSPNTTAAQLSAANTALKAAQDALKKLQSQSKASGSGGGSGGGTSAGGSGGGSSKGGSKPSADKLIPVDANGDYMEKSDPTTLYNNDGSVKANLDTNSGMFVDAGGKLVAAGDGTPVMNSDSATGAYQESDGTWYLNDGTALKNYDPTNQTYTEADGSVYSMAGDYLGDTGVYTDNNNSPIVTSDGAPVDATAIDSNYGTYAPMDYGTGDNYGNFSGAGSKHFAGFVGAGTLFK